MSKRNIDQPLPHERKVDYHSIAGLRKHDYKFRERTDIRLAGEIWDEGEGDRERRLRRGRRQKTTRSTPVGLGFGVDDGFGPDDSWESKENLNSKSDPARYMR